MKKLLLTLFSILTLGLASYAQDTAVQTCLFGSDYNSKGVSAYNVSWTATNNDFTWDIVNFNNNNNVWDYVRCGSKNNASVATITTQSPIKEAVSNVVVTINKITTANVNSISLKVSSTNDFDNATSYPVTMAVGAQKVEIPSPAANMYYQLVCDCKSGTNGVLEIQQVAYYAGEAPSGPEMPDAPEGEITVAEALSLIQDGYVGEATVKGIVSRVTYFNATYGSVTYYISDDGGNANDLQVYGGLGLNGAKFNAQSEVEVGASVVVKGKLKMYNGTPEFDTNSVLLSYTAPTGGETPEPEPEIPEGAVTQPFKRGLNFPEGAQGAVPTSPTTITASDTGISYTLYGTNVNTGGYLMMASKTVEGAYISWSLEFPMSQLILTNTSGASKNAVVNVYANDQLIKEKLALTELSTNYTVDIPAEYQKAGTTFKVESATTQYNTQFASFTYVPTTDEPVEPEPAYTATFNFTGVENAYLFVEAVDMMEDDFPQLAFTSPTYVVSNEKPVQLSFAPIAGYSIDIKCTTPGLVEGKDYQIMNLGTEERQNILVGGFKTNIDIAFDVIVSGEETPEVTVNLSGAYKDGITMALSTNDDEYEIIDLTSDTYTIDLSQYADGQFPLFISFQTKEGYNVEVTGNLEEGPNTYLIMPIGQGGSGTNVLIFPGAAGLELTANVTAEAEEIPVDAYVVYYNGEFDTDLNPEYWWNATCNFKAMNPDGVGMAFEFKATDGGSDASMGLMAKNAKAVGPLHNGILTIEWSTVGTGKYIVRLTGGGKEYNYDLNSEDVPAGAATWNTTTINIAEKEALAAAWDVVTSGGDYPFSIILTNGKEGDAIYFNKIYYTNVDESWTAPEAPAPETVPAPEQPQDMMLSFLTQYGQEAYNVGGWGQSTQAENTTIDGKPVIAMTNFNYLGLVDFDINISDYDYMHVDYWTNSENTPFGFVPISLNPTQDNPIWNAETVKANEWNSYDVALSFWENVDMTSIEQIKFVANQQGGTTPYGYIANIYFWKEAAPEGPDAIYVVGNGEGLTWDLPGTKYDVVNGVATFTVNNLQAFKASINNTTEWDNEGGFNAGCYGTGTNAFGDAVANTGGQTLKMELWGDNQEVPWAGTYTITMNFNTMEMTAFTTTPKPVEAPDVYVRGDMNGWLNSGMQDAWKFANVSWDATAQTGVFKLENVSIKAGQTFKIGDSTWGSVNYGGVSGIMINELTDLKYNDQTNLTLAQDFEGDITFTITSAKSTANVIFEMEGPVKDPDQFYVIGTLAEGSWNPTVGVKMESNGNGKYTAEKVTLIESEGSTGFAITANLGTDSNDWTSVNALRFGPAQNDAMAVIGNNTDLAMGDLSWTFTPGTYTMVFDYTNKTLNIEEYVEPVLPDNIDVTFDFNSYDNVKEYAGLTGTMEQEFAQQGSTRYYIIKKLENGGIELTGDKGTYAGSLPYNSPYVNVVTTSGSMTFRMQVGNTFTISAPEGYTLKNVTFGGTMANYVSGPMLVAGEPGSIGAATTSSPYTRTWTAPEEGTVNTITFTLPSGSCILKTINVVAEKVEETEPALNTLVFEDWTMEVSNNQATPETADVPVSLDVDEPLAYQGFQFDIQLPAGLQLVDPVTLNAALNGSVSFSLYNEANNVYRVIAHSEWAEDGYNLTEDLVTLTVATTYPSEDGLATLIASGDYDVTITNIDFSSALGDDIDNFNDFTGTVTIVNAEVPATDLTINSVTLNKPSYTTPSSNMVEEVVQGESVTINATLLPKDTTDELTADADNGATVESVEFDEETGTWNIVVNTDEVEVETGQEVTVIITITAGDQEETYELTVKGVLLGDSNDNGVVTVADVVTTANYMVDSPVETFCFPNANVMLTPGEDGEQVIDAADLTATINIVLDDFDGKRQIRRYSNRAFINDRLVADNFKAGNSSIAVNLDNTTDYAALQATIVIPDGVTVNKVTKGIRAKDHELTWNHIANEGVVKVVLYSLENKSFPNVEGSLFNIEVIADEQCGDFTIIDINASNAKNNGFDLSFDGGFFEANATGIDGIGTEDADVRYFTVDGIEVFNPEHGQILIRIQNGEATKVMVK